MTAIYVIGHVNPDMDSIASAIGYAWLIRERDGEEAIPARAGALNPQTTWVLDHLNIEAPKLIVEVSKAVCITMRVSPLLISSLTTPISVIIPVNIF